MKKGQKQGLPYCAKGHPFTPENTFTTKPGRQNYRACKTCSAQSAKEFRKRKALWTIWRSMRQRCTDPNATQWHLYGGRRLAPVTICERWLWSYDAFAADMGPRPSPKHTLDRIDPHVGYSPENCRWATAKEQSLNRRDTIFVMINGIKKPLKQWTDEVGVATYQNAWRRIVEFGWTPEKAVFTPARPMRHAHTS